ncbi:MAG: HAD hydrolase family protein, partial [Pseudomonadota bacterium]
AHHANRLLAAEGLLTGALAQPILGADAKRERLQAECAALGIPLTQSAALGDGANDLPMIQSAGLGIAWRAKPQVRTAADAALEHTDLSAVCYALGCIPEAAASGT